MFLLWWCRELLSLSLSLSFSHHSLSWIKLQAHTRSRRRKKVNKTLRRLSIETINEEYTEEGTIVLSLYVTRYTSTNEHTLSQFLFYSLKKKESSSNKTKEQGRRIISIFSTQALSSFFFPFSRFLSFSNENSKHKKIHPRVTLRKWLLCHGFGCVRIWMGV